MNVGWPKLLLVSFLTLLTTMLSARAEDTRRVGAIHSSKTQWFHSPIFAKTQDAVFTNDTGLAPASLRAGEPGTHSDGKETTPIRPAAVPGMTTGNATGITKTSATLNGILETYDDEVTYYFDWGKTTAYGSITGKRTASWVVLFYSSILNGLTCDTVYHYRAVGYWTSWFSTHYAYGADVQFRTLPCLSPPIVTTGAATSVGPTTATLNGTVNPNGLATTAYFEYGESSSYGFKTAEQAYAAGTSQLSLTKSLTGLKSDTAYYYRAVATSADGTAYGVGQKFKTLPSPTGPPLVTTGAATAITPASATLNGTINPNGLATAWSFQWGLTAAYGNTTPEGTLAAGTTASPIALALTGLKCATTYHFRAVGKNSAGTVYGSDQFFATLACPTGPPIVVTTVASSVASTTANLNGTVNPNGLNTTWYFQWGKPTYVNTTSSHSLPSGYTAVPIREPLSGLVCGTTYRFRAVGVNSAGTTYGDDRTFTTPACSEPTVGSGHASAITISSATLNATVNPNGTATTANFEWGATATYGNSTPAQDVGSGTAAVSLMESIRGLACASTYHFRARAVNKNGAAYGTDESFVTPTCVCSAAKGDVNGNGSVSAFDAALVLQHVVGLTSLADCEKCGADYNGNNSVTAYDAAQILSCVANPASCSKATCK